MIEPIEVQRAVQSALEQMVAQERENGLQAAVYFRGELVVNAYAGTADAAGTPVTEETLFPVFSTTKGMMATAIHMLVERGKLDLDAPICTYWPEFAAAGKEDILLRHALGHTAGLPHVPPGVSRESINDWDAVCSAIAASAAVSVPGEREEYHAITYGWILGELLRRVDGRPFSDFLKQEICAPLGISTLHCGISEELESTVATLEEPDYVPVEIPAERVAEAIPYWLRPLGGWMNSADARQTCQPASSGIMNAHAIARHYAALVADGVDGVQLLSPATVQRAISERRVPNDELSGFGLGYQVAGSPASGEGTTFGHGGHGGSLGYGDVKHGWSFGFTRNRFTETSPGHEILNIVKRALELDV